jgi:hypothetical protein
MRVLEKEYYSQSMSMSEEVQSMLKNYHSGNSRVGFDDGSWTDNGFMSRQESRYDTWWSIAKEKGLAEADKYVHPERYMSASGNKAKTSKPPRQFWFKVKNFFQNILSRSSWKRRYNHRVPGFQTNKGNRLFQGTFWANHGLTFGFRVANTVLWDITIGTPKFRLNGRQAPTFDQGGQDFFPKSGPNKWRFFYQIDSGDPTYYNEPCLAPFTIFGLGSFGGKRFFSSDEIGGPGTTSNHDWNSLNQIQNSGSFNPNGSWP